jgi:hypothetical protein
VIGYASAGRRAGQHEIIRVKLGDGAVTQRSHPFLAHAA